MQAKSIQSLKAIGVICVFLFLDLIVISWCYDRSNFTNKYLVLDHLDYVDAEPAALEAGIQSVSDLPDWMKVPGYEILSVETSGDDAGKITLRDADGATIQGTVHKSRISNRNGNSISFAVKDGEDGLLFEYRITLQKVSGITRITHMAAAPAMRSDLIRMSREDTAALKGRMIQTHARLEALFGHENSYENGDEN
ncbi:MAG: DUF4539 domain-containing protein [bacterium]|nr:DUF4539 domain-containing protein [bacterium]